MLDLVRMLLTSAPDAIPCASLDDFRARHAGRTRDVASPIDRAIIGGLFADRVAYAFAAGYLAALEALLGERFAGAPASLCVTERGGAHPRAIQTTLRPGPGGGLLLTGEKRWTTLAGSGAGLLLVAASTGVVEGRNRIRLVRTFAQRPGVTVTPMDAPPFIPEIPHAEVRFDDVTIDDRDVLEGDGYERYVKPFRTVEDLHVHAALLAHLLGEARARAFPRPFQETAVALLCTARTLAAADPLAPEVHIALAGLLSLARRLVDEASDHWTPVDDAARARWDRDRVLLGVAEGARAKRLDSAHRALADGRR